MRSSATCIKRQTLLYIQKLRHGNFHVTFPIYDPSTPDSVAWERLISTIASAKMEFNDISYERDFTHFDRTTTIQLLYLFPHPSRHYWFPSWAQVQQYPDVSVRDNDPVLVAGNMDYSLHMDYSLCIMSGRIYYGCSLELKWPPTSKAKAAYHCSMGMGSEIVELAATVPALNLILIQKVCLFWLISAQIVAYGPLKKVRITARV